MVPMAARDNGHLEHFRLTKPNSKNRFCDRKLSQSSFGPRATNPME
jgi:hypothetical protein